MNNLNSKQVFKTPVRVFNKQTDVYAVQTPVQTPNFLDILKNLSSNERMLIFTLLNK